MVIKTVRIAVILHNINTQALTNVSQDYHPGLCRAFEISSIAICTANQHSDFMITKPTVELAIKFVEQCNKCMILMALYPVHPSRLGYF